MPVLSEVELGLPLFETPPRLNEEWAETLKGAALNINTKRIARVGTEELFATRLAAPSSLAYNPFPNSAFVSRSGLTKDMITRNQRTNLTRSFQKYKSQLDFAFETVDGIPAKRFKDLVDRGKNDFSRGVAERTLRATGVKAEQLGTSPIAGFWLTNDPTTEGYLRGDDKVLFGGPFLISPVVKTAGLKAMLVSRLTFVIIQALKAELDPTIITALNGTTNDMVQAFVDPALDISPFVTGGDSRVDLENDPVSGPIVHIKVTRL